MIKLRLAAALLLLSVSGVTEEPPGSPQFEAASVRIARPGGRFSMDSDPGRIEYRGLNLRGLVWVAYSDELNIHQYVWPESLIGHLKDYDISATFPPNTRDEQVHLMLQRLLADRFKMVSHRETREAPVYALTVPKGGPRIQKSENPPDPKALSISVHLGPDGWRLNDHLSDTPPSGPHGITLAKLTLYFNNNGIFDRMLVDRTGLEGYYGINMSILFDAESERGPAENLAPKSPAMPDADRFRDALQSQLGLKVESQTAPVKMLVIDRLESVPTGN
jgi:uncharacterized protein (TIGR03435 family)